MRCTVADVQTVHHRAAHGPEAHRHPPRDLRDAPRAGRGREQDARLLPLDLEGGHARRPALPVEREDAVRQDVRRLPARQEARRQARARRDVQASRRGCLADRPRIPRRLRRLAVPLAVVRQRSDDRSTRRSPLVYFGSFQDLLGRDRPATSRPRTSGSTSSTGTSSSSTSTTSAHGATPPRSCSRARTTRSPRRRPSSSTPPTSTSVNEDLERAIRERDRVPADHHQGVPLPLRHAVQGAGDRRVHRGADLQLDLHRRAARQGRVRREASRASGTPTARCRRCACSPTRCPTSCSRSPARASSTSSTSTSSSPRRARVTARSSSTRTTCRSGSTSSVAPTRRPRSTTSSSAASARRSRTPTSGCCRTCSTRSGSCRTSPRVTRWRTCWPRSTTRSGTTTRCSPSPALRPGSGSTRCRPSGRRSAAASRPRRSRSHAASSRPASPCRSGRRS